MVHPEALGADGVHDEEVAVRLVPLGGCRTEEAGLPAVVAEVEGASRQVARRETGGDLAHIARQIDEHPVPEPAGRGGVGIEAGDGEGRGSLGRVGPAQVRRRVPPGGHLVVLQRPTVGHVVADDVEGRHGGQERIGIGGLGARQINHDRTIGLRSDTQAGLAPFAVAR